MRQICAGWRSAIPARVPGGIRRDGLVGGDLAVARGQPSPTTRHELGSAVWEGAGKPDSLSGYQIGPAGRARHEDHL